MISLLGPALGGAAGGVVAGELVPAQPHQHDPVQRGVGLPVAAPVEPVPDGLARGRLDGQAPHSAAKAASLVRRVGLSPAATSKAAALSGPTPSSARSLGAWRAVSSSSCLVELADLGVQVPGSAGRGCAWPAWWPLLGWSARPGQWRRSWISRTVGSPVRDSRSSAGAVTTRALRALMAWVRALTAVCRAARSAGASRLPVGGLGGAGRLAGLDRAGRGIGIDRVALAAPPPGRAVGSVDLTRPAGRERPGSGPTRRRNCRCLPPPTPRTSPRPSAQASS